MVVFADVQTGDFWYSIAAAAATWSNRDTDLSFSRAGTLRVAAWPQLSGGFPDLARLRY